MKKCTLVVMVLVVCALLAVGIVGCGTADDTQTDTTTQNEQQEQETPTAPKEQTGSGNNGFDEGDIMHKVQIDVKDYGTIIVELDETKAPITVENFLKLVRSGFYDGLTFHRIMNGIMMQGGDPEGTGMGGSGENIKGEFANNGVPNPISHVRGVISMARSQDPDSASSQFFIMHKDSLFLDGEYAAFGRVLEGMDVVDRICEEVPVTDGNGSVAKGSEPVIESIKVLD